MPKITRSTRQPLGELNTKASLQKKLQIKRRKSREIGDQVDLFIQEKKYKTGKLHRASVDCNTGGITFTPGNRKTPVSYDKRRHLLIEKTPKGDKLCQIELDDDQTDSETEDDDEEEPVVESEEDEVPAPPVKTTTTTRGGDRGTKRKTYAESSGESDDESDFEEAIKKKKKKTTKAETMRRQSPRVSKKKKVTFVPRPTEDSDDEDIDEEPEDNTNSTAFKASQTFSSPIAKSNWNDNQGDWRCQAAFDW